MDSRRPVLIIDGGSRGDIGVIRSLGVGRVPVHLLVTDPRSPSVASRYVTQVYPFPGLGAPDEACLAAIHAVARTLPDRPVMFATGDRALALMSRWRGELAEILDHDMASAEMIETCLNKDQFAPVARRLGLPVPETFAPASVAAARALADRLPYPVFVKPVDHADWGRLPTGTVKSIKGERFDSCPAFLRLVDVLERHDAPHFVVQEFVPGGDQEHISVHAYVLPDRTVAGVFTGIKLRIAPPYAGLGCYVLSQRLPALEALARHLLTVIEYTGFVDFQFKRDVCSGEYKILEINCRYSTWTELPSRAGCNFPLTAYATLVGDTLPQLAQREGAAWLDLERDLDSMQIYRAAGEWTWGAYLRSLATVRYWAYFAWDDPAPFVRKVLNRKIRNR